MSAWRREAIKFLLEHKELIERADIISFLWSELIFEFEQAYRKKPKDERTIAGVYDFAAWCQHDARN